MSTRASLASSGIDEGGEGAQMLLFRVGGELFALDLDASEEALEFPALERLAAMPASALGVFTLRDQLVSVFSPERALRVQREGDSGVVLVIHAGGRRIALALDDVEEVISVDLSNVKRPSPRDAADGVLVGIARHGDSLVGVVDVEALAAVCVGSQAGDLS